MLVAYKHSTGCKCQKWKNIWAPYVKTVRGTIHFIWDIFNSKYVLNGSFYLKVVLGRPHCEILPWKSWILRFLPFLQNINYNIPENKKVGKSWPKPFENIQLLYPFLVIWDSRVNSIPDFFSPRNPQKLRIPKNWVPLWPF